MIQKFITIIRKNASYIIKDLSVLTLIIAFVVCTILYLYKYHKKKKSYALNIVLTAFVSRMTGMEFIEVIKIRMLRISYYI